MPVGFKIMLFNSVAVLYVLWVDDLALGPGSEWVDVISSRVPQNKGLYCIGTYYIYGQFHDVTE